MSAGLTFKSGDLVAKHDFAFEETLESCVGEVKKEATLKKDNAPNNRLPSNTQFPSVHLPSKKSGAHLWKAAVQCIFTYYFPKFEPV